MNELTYEQVRLANARFVEEINKAFAYMNTETQEAHVFCMSVQHNYLPLHAMCWHGPNRIDLFYVDGSTRREFMQLSRKQFEVIASYV